MPAFLAKHGRFHRPDGPDPVYAQAWHYVAAAATAWSSATAYNPGDIAQDGNFNWKCLIANTNHEPGVASDWATYWKVSRPIFLNSWTNFGGTTMPMGYRLVVGEPIAGRDIHTGHASLEVGGVVTGGTANAAIFQLPDGYRPGFKMYRPASDSSGAFVVYTVDTDGQVYHGLV